MEARVVIIGAGPAGSAAAASIVRSGAARAGDVLIVEAKAFPRVKVCGEFVSPAATAVLEELVGVDGLVQAGARRVWEMVLELGDLEHAWRMPVPAWTLSRRSLDDVMLGVVRGLGVRVEQPVRVGGVEYRGDGVHVSLADGRVIQTELVIHADGSGRHDHAGPVRMRSGVVGMKCHFRPRAPLVGVRMRAAPGAYVGTVQVEGGEATCAMTVSARAIGAFKGDADAMVSAIWPGWEPSARTSEWLSCGVAGSGYVQPGHVRSLRVGNAAGAVEPIGGEGIGMALWGGWRVGALLGEFGLARVGEAERAFAREYRARLRVRRPACALAASVLMRPMLVRALWPVVTVPGAMRGWYGLSGKPSEPLA